MVKVKRQHKLHEGRLIYISWFLGAEERYVKWVDDFYDKVLVETDENRNKDGTLRFLKARRTGDSDPGTLRNIDELLAKVTDIVAVLTARYARVNQGTLDGEPEFAKFAALREQDKAGGKRAWIAPLERFNTIRIAKIDLSRDEGWRFGLRPIGSPFRLPPDPIDAEISEAVREILGEMDD
jgi:hypothetical protein